MKNRSRPVFALAVVLMTGVGPVFSDSREDLRFILQSRGLIKESQDETANDSTPLHEDVTNELKLFAFLALRFYQLVISTQDRPSCMFTPSCSQYAMAAIRKYGFFRGVLMAADRLQRCNGWGRDLYPLDLATGKLYDPP